MQSGALIDEVVRQTTVLIAHLATAAGVRAPRAHVANQVFLDLVGALEAQGLGRKVVADMFGIALRSYQLKVQRLSESLTERNRSLWEAVLGFVQEEGRVGRRRVLERFQYDDEPQVRAVLNDLVESGLVYRAGRGDGTTYRAAEPEDLGAAFASDPDATAEHMAWITIYRDGPIDRVGLQAQVKLPDGQLDRALQRLEADGRVQRVEGEDGPRWRCDHCWLPRTTVGWEAAVFDHFQAMVQALCVKLTGGVRESLPDDVVGGSTWSFDVWPGHPFEDEVLGVLRELRSRVTTLRKRVTGPAPDACPPGPDTCVQDAECADGDVCVTPAAHGVRNSMCVRAACTADADCVDHPEGQCTPFLAPCRELGFFCTYAVDPCRVDADCPDRGAPKVCEPIEGGAGTQCVDLR